MPVIKIVSSKERRERQISVLLFKEPGKQEWADMGLGVGSSLKLISSGMKNKA